jgi:hypothetical protein
MPLYQMDEEKIEVLKARRLQMQQGIRLKKIRDRVASQIADLEKLDQSFNVYYESENLNWIDSNVPVRKRDGYKGIHGDFQIDVEDSTATSIHKIREEEINSAKFLQQFSSLIPANSSIIVCYQGGDPELEISIKAFLSHPTEFLSRSETWVIATDKS